MITRLRTVVVLSCGLVAASCGGSPSEPDAEPFVSFAYGGAVSGSFRAEGTLRPGSALPEPGGATGAWNDGRPIVLSASPRSDGRTNQATLTITRGTPGTAQILSRCSGTTPCAELVMAMPAGTKEGPQDPFACWLEAGTLRMVEASANRVRGTFEGTGVCGGRSGVAVGPFHVTGGRFDVPLD